MHLKALVVLMYCDSSAPWRKNSTKSFEKTATLKQIYLVVVRTLKQK